MGCTQIRGKLISIAEKRRKTRQALITELSNRVHSIESRHKQSLTNSLYNELLKAREALLDELGKTTRPKFALTRKLFYESGNKSGKLLARTFQSKKAALTIYSITVPNGKKIFTSSEITKLFQNFYSKLYNLPPQTSKDPSTDRKKLISDFLSTYSPTPISPLEATELDKPINWNESVKALKWLKTG